MRPPPATRSRRLALSVYALACAGAVGLAGCGALPAGSSDPAAAAVSGAEFIVVAVADVAEVRAGAGAAVRGAYGRGAGYAASGRALADAEALARAHGLVEVKAWTIQALNWRCLLYRLPEGAARPALLAQLAADTRVQLVQALNDFQTLAAPERAAAVPSGRGGAGAAPPYDDPYLALQTGFAAIDAAGAQRQTRGEGVRVAVVDSHIDASHPDLRGRVSLRRDFVGRPVAGEAHGTEVAGVIAALANNGLGIAGIAPAASLLALRSCWSEAVAQPARCNSFTLAQGLAAAIDAGADVINLSLAGPHDPLLEALARRAMAGGAVLVAALPASGRREGFPTALPGVLAVAASEAGAAPAGVLAAPGRQVLTLAPGGGYDFASGSSMASAHVSGAVALLRSRGGPRDSARLAGLLAGDAGQVIDACRALVRINPGPSPAACGARPAGPPPPVPSAAGSPVRAPARP